MDAATALWILSNLTLFAALVAEKHRNRKYREAIHGLLADEGYVEGEPQAYIDETLRMTAHIGSPEPSAHDFAHALVGQKGFRKAIAHEELHRVYLETYGRGARNG